LFWRELLEADQLKRFRNGDKAIIDAKDNGSG
jgi:hypothetical protein